MSFLLIVPEGHKKNHDNLCSPRVIPRGGSRGPDRQVDLSVIRCPTKRSCSGLQEGLVVLGMARWMHYRAEAWDLAEETGKLELDEC